MVYAAVSACFEGRAQAFADGAFLAGGLEDAGCVRVVLLANTTF